MKHKFLSEKIARKCAAQYFLNSTQKFISVVQRNDFRVEIIDKA